jgi:signal transduction histidine kinase
MKSMRTHSHHVLISRNCFAGANPRWLAGMLFTCSWLASVAVADKALAVGEVTTFQQFNQLSNEQSREGRPVRFQGVVLCYDLGWGQLYVHDGSDIRWFNAREISTQPASGQQVEITGTTTVVGNVNALTNLNLTVLRQGAFPVAKILPPAQLTNALGQWVETYGRVRVVDFSRERMQLLLHENGRSCRVFVLAVPQTNELKRLLGARIRVRGINDTKVVDGHFDAAMFVPGLDQVTIIEPAGANQILPRAVSIDNLLNRELGEWTNSPVRINGSVVSSEPGKKLIVKDPTGVLRAQVIQFTAARNDDRVDVSGFLKVTPNETFLGDAWFEVIKPAPSEAGGIPVSRVPSGEVRVPELLTKVSEILKLQKGESMQHWPVRLRGVVLYADPEWRNGFLRDQSGAVYFDLNQNDVRPGQWVELTGETGPGGFAPEILNTSVRVLGTTNYPLAASVDLTDLADGHLDAQWVEMEGVIRRVSLEWNHLSLIVMTDKGKFRVVIPGLNNQMAPTNLIDALVSIQGACTSELNARRQVRGITLHVPGLDRIKILEPAPADPFTIAATPIASVATFDPDRLAGRRVKVSGVVTLKIPDQGFFIQDVGGGIFVRHGQTNELQPGDLVDVLGFPALGDFSPELEEASLRRTGDSSNVVGHKTKAEEILLQGVHDAMLVTLEGRLLQNVPRSANPQLVLQDGAIIFTARLQDSGQGWKMPALESGSQVRLSGVCSIQRGEQREPKGFRLRLRSAADVVLISNPPWWSTKHTLWVLGGLGGVLAGSLAWGRSMRRQVKQQTSRLLQQIAEREGMQVQIEKTHKQLLHASRQAGMAEVASSVLHNVGNVLNSVNISATLVDDNLRNSKAANLARVVALLQEHSADLGAFITLDPKGKQLPAYLAQLSGYLGAEQEGMIKEMRLLRNNIEHIKEIVAMQQSYAKLSGITELLNVTDLVEDTLRMNAGALVRHEVKVIREFDSQVPEISTDRHKVLQILVNLVRNAKYACSESGRTDKKLTVRVTNGDDRVRIAVTDNGVGIAPENLTRIFAHGFTTKKDGHGFGLHSGALAAKEMGGSLKVHSAGVGQGATFSLELPIEPAKRESSDLERNPVQ